jgi:hypothetical protein
MFGMQNRRWSHGAVFLPRWLLTEERREGNQESRRLGNPQLTCNRETVDVPFITCLFDSNRTLTQLAVDISPYHHDLVGYSKPLRKNIDPALSPSV